MTKYSYINATNKKRVREFLLTHFTFNTVVGLAGPDINEWIGLFEQKGCSNFKIYENDKMVLLSQLSKLKTNSDVSLVYGDIIEASVDPGTFLDLDYCCSVRYRREDIAKFRDNFIMTFSTRIGVQETIDTFFDARGESILSQEDVESPIKHTVFKTDGGKYLFTKYRDTSAMCCFAKIA